ncbi:MAG: ribosome recycling factor [Proteobacteria bacterium]|nr:ribosome recycling factor [Pseudomonadota bacterium]NBX86875.1 ribosome recycling factor [Pseudomonadota bacterium]
MSDLKQRLDGAIASLKHEFGGLRTGRATTSLLDPVMVDAYGSKMSLSQVGTVSVADARLLTVNVWDKSQMAAVEKAIRESGLGLNPMADGQMIRIPLPELNEQRRQELVKLAKKYAEEAKVAVRNLRRDGLDALKVVKEEQGEDAHKRETEKLEKQIGDYIAQIDALAAAKEKEITTI